MCQAALETVSSEIVSSASPFSTTASPCCILTGINQYESDKPARYVSNTNLSSRVASLNPSWNGDQSEEASNVQFQKAMQLTGHEFTEALDYYSNVSIHNAYYPLICTSGCMNSAGFASKRHPLRLLV